MNEDHGWWVFYQDDWDEMGGKGLTGFGAEEEALQFIQDRMKNKGLDANLNHYTLIEGNRWRLKPVEVVTKLGLE